MGLKWDILIALSLRVSFSIQIHVGGVSFAVVARCPVVPGIFCLFVGCMVSVVFPSQLHPSPEVMVKTARKRTTKFRPLWNDSEKIEEGHDPVQVHEFRPIFHILNSGIRSSWHSSKPQGI